MLQGSHTFHIQFSRTFPGLFKDKIKIFQDNNSCKSMLSRIRIFKEFLGFFQDIFIIFFFPGLFQAWKLIFSFSRFSSMRGNPALYWIFPDAWEPCPVLDFPVCVGTLPCTGFPVCVGTLPCTGFSRMRGNPALYWIFQYAWEPCPVLDFPGCVGTLPCTGFSSMRGNPALYWLQNQSLPKLSRTPIQNLNPEQRN